MARIKKESSKVREEEIDFSKIVEHITEQKVSDMLKENMMPYSMSVIISRALVEIDGLKPSHRKVLYTMYLMGLLTGGRSKSANICGQTLKLNPHSDSAAYETMVRLTDDNETLLCPLVDSKGNLGKHYSRDMAFSASRYCVAGDTLIPTSRGLIPIQDVVRNNKIDKEYSINIQVKSKDSKNNKASKLFNSGEHNTYTITLKNGMELTGSFNHPVLIVDENNKSYWKILEDIQVGDKCIIDLDDSNALFGNNNDLLEARMLGAMISKGYKKNKNIIGIEDKNRELLFPVFAYFKSKFPRNRSNILLNKENQKFNYEISGFKVCNDFLKTCKFSSSIRKRTIPDKVLRGTKEYQSLFLQYLFEGNAFVKKGKRISFVTYSKKLAQQVQVLLSTNFGIYSDLDFSKEKGTYKLFIPYAFFEKFNKEIGFISKDKQNLICECEKGINDIENYKYIPIISKKYSEKQVVYSVKVESDCHSFSANGFINHNTEAKLSNIAEELFRGINKNAVDFVDNYDSTMKEPTLLPVSFPNILANPNQGIAVGMASNICSFNLKELCEATILHIKKPKADILEVMKGPDFTTGGYLLFEEDVIRQVYNTGKGSIKLKAKYRIDKRKNIIEIIQIPYTTTIEAIIEGVIDLVKKGKIKEVSDIRDETDKNGLKIAIDYKKSCDPELLMKKLFKMTKLQDNFSCNFNILIEGKPRVMGVYEILDEWIKWRQQCINREYIYDLNRKKRDLHMLRGLEKILLNLNKVIKIVRESPNDQSVIFGLVNSFKIDEEQANYIADIKLRNLNKEYIVNRTKDILKIEDDIIKLNNIIDNPKEINKIIINTLTTISKKYGIDRKTEIIPYEEEVFTEEEIIDDYQLMLYRTRDGYIKKLPLTSLKNNSELKIKENDAILQEIQVSNKTEIIFFTNKCNIYKILCYNIKDCKPSEFGEYSNNLLEMDSDEELLYMCPITFGENVIIGFENGKVTKYPLSSYETKNNRKKLINAFYSGSKVLNIFVTTKDIDLGITASNDKLLIFNTKDIPLKTSKTQGIQTIKLLKNCVATSLESMEHFKLESKTGFGYKSLPASGGKFILT